MQRGKNEHLTFAAIETSVQFIPVTASSSNHSVLTLDVSRPRIIRIVYY